jgi:hypothetical protein
MRRYDPALRRFSSAAWIDFALCRIRMRQDSRQKLYEVAQNNGFTLVDLAGQTQIMSSITIHLILLLSLVSLT